MAIGAAYYAFIDFFLESRKAYVALNEHRYGVCLGPTNVVKFENHNVFFAAIYAWMAMKMSEDILAEFGNIRSFVAKNICLLSRLIPCVPFASVFILAGST